MSSERTKDQALGPGIRDIILGPICSNQLGTTSPECLMTPFGTRPCQWRPAPWQNATDDNFVMVNRYKRKA
jgi:hypothetical protein